MFLYSLPHSCNLLKIIGYLWLVFAFYCLKYIIILKYSEMFLMKKMKSLQSHHPGNMDLYTLLSREFFKIPYEIGMLMLKS